MKLSTVNTKALAKAKRAKRIARKTKERYVKHYIG